MVVDDDEPGRAQFERSGHDLPDVDRGAVDGAPAHDLVPYEHVAAVEVQDAKAFHGRERHVRSEIIEQRSATDQDRSTPHRGSEHMQHRLPEGQDPAGGSGIAAANLEQSMRRCGRRRSQRAELGDQLSGCPLRIGPRKVLEERADECVLDIDRVARRCCQIPIASAASPG